MEKGQIQTSPITSMYQRATETLHREADGPSPQLPAPSPADQVAVAATSRGRTKAHCKMTSQPTHGGAELQGMRLF